jgi:hypothetical protein
MAVFSPDIQFINLFLLQVIVAAFDDAATGLFCFNLKPKSPNKD